MRQADINRVKRAIEHIKAAMNHIDNIKYLYRTGDEDRKLNDIWKDLKYDEMMLEAMTR